MENRQTEHESKEMIDARAIIFDDTREQNLFLLVRGPYNIWGLPGEIIIGQESEIESTLQGVFEEMNLRSLEVLPDSRYQTIMYYHPRDKKDIIPVRFSVGAVKGDLNASLKLNERHRECKWVPYENVLRSLPFSQQKRAYSPQQQPQKEIFEEICRIKDLRPF